MAFPDGVADFRSDTVTRPTGEMYAAMTSAPLGDDVYSDDPTVNRLQDESAQAVGKEAGLFVPTGTMGNQLAIMLQTNPGEEVLANSASHVRSVEGGAAQAFSGVGFRTVDRGGGLILRDDVDAAVGMAGFFPRISLMTWENTHNLSGGRVIPFDVLAETSEAARHHSLAVHIDGARIWNAVAATGIDGARWAENADTIQFCFSKGLGAPVGSIVCGDRESISEMRYLRKRYGGGMRQAGVLAAAALVALSTRDRLVDDHVLAQRLAIGLADAHPGSVDPSEVDTNIVRVDFELLGLDWLVLKDKLSAEGIKVNPPMAGGWRLVTHRDVDGRDVDRLLTVLR